MRQQQQQQQQHHKHKQKQKQKQQKLQNSYYHHHHQHHHHHSIAGNVLNGKILPLFLVLFLSSLLLDSISCFSSTTTTTATTTTTRNTIRTSTFTFADYGGQQRLKQQQQQQQQQQRVSSFFYDSRRTETKMALSSNENINENENTNININDDKLKLLKFHEIVERDQKQIPIVSSLALALKLFIVVPIWITFVLPLTIVYQISKLFVDRIGNSLKIIKDEEVEDDDTSAAASAASAATGADAAAGAVKTTAIENENENENNENELVITVDPNDIIPRKDRKYDVVMLGATGFTGGLAVRHLVKTYYNNNNNKKNDNNNKDGNHIKWAIAGRSETKLKQVLEKLALEFNIPNLVNDIDIIICDTINDPQSLTKLVYNTKSVATTVGPFSIYGENVIKYCVNYGTHYTDITGEISFVKLMKSKYQSIAIKTGSKILNFCGNDCVPWDISYNLLANEFSNEFSNNNNNSGDGTSSNNKGSSDNESLEKIEFINEFSSSASGGTLKTMCMGIDGRLAKPRAEDENILRRSNQNIEHDQPMENNISFGIESSIQKPWKIMNTSSRTADENDNNSNNDKIVTAPFVMSGVNYEAISWSHALRKDPTCSYKEQLVQPDLKTAVDGVLGLIIFFTSLMNPITGTLIEKYIITKPGDGPSMYDMNNKYFLAVTGTAYGNKGTIIQSLLYYNKDPGYLETARMVVECSLCLAAEEANNNDDDDDDDDGKKKITGIDSGGGFFSPGFALRKTLLKRLVDTGCYYELRVVQEAEAEAEPEADSSGSSS